MTRTIPALVARAAAEFGDREALVDGESRWTFAELADEVYRCAGAMIAAGVSPGDRVALWAPNGHRFVVASLGAVTAGAVLVPVNTRFKGDEAGWILGKSGARLLLVENGFLGHDYLAMLRGAAAERRTVLHTIIDLGRDWADFLGHGAEVAREDVLARAAGVGADDIADMFFTSGTTGRPKGVMCAHEQNLRVFSAWCARVGLRAGDRYLIVNPMFHTFGYKAGVLACLLRGATMVSVPWFDVAAVSRLIAAERITVLPGPPTLYASLLAGLSAGGADLSSLRLAVTGAAVVPVALIERMRAELFPEVVIAYGLTESCGTVTVGDPAMAPELMARTVGTAIEGTEVTIAGNGEVLVHGYNVMRGYFDDPLATSEAIDADGWLHTGDVGVLDAEGNLSITDRLKDVYISGGFNVYPAEVEQVITRHPAVSEAAVVGVPDSRLGEVGVAYVVVRAGLAVRDMELIGFCGERLANFKVPRVVRVVDALPRNASGKVLKYELRSRQGTPT
jgi:acyl-CoA synthetase (AMP-forming)/AMP-acid ligase II